MANLTLLALTFAALLAIASAYTTTTIVTTNDRRGSSQESCGREIQGQRFNQCQRYLQQSIQGQQGGQQQQGLQSCCNELENVDEMCQCEAVKQVFRQVQSQMQQQQGRERGGFGAQQIQRLKQQAQNLPNQCNLQTRRCQIGSVYITTTTVTEEEEDDISYDRSRGSQQQCQHVQQQSFNQCQRYVQKQTSGRFTLLMSINRQTQPQEVEQCCRELKNVEEECQCEAMQEIYRQAQRQQQQQQSRRRGEQQTQDVKQVVERLRNECNLEVEQCRIPSRMF